jgi:predicted NACHT family NTPase
MLEQIQEAGANKLIDSVERIYRELKEEWNYHTKDKINQYLTSMMQRYGEVKTILHGNNPRPFYEVYYPLSLSINGRLISSDATTSLFRRRQALIITADAGSGKSMLVKHLFNSSINLSYKIPFVIELRYLNSSNDTLDKFIDDQISLHVTASSRIKRRLLEEGKFIFFLDGYDEVKIDKKQEVVRSLKEMHERYTSCKYLISTRPYTDLEMLSNLSTMHILPLSKSDVEKFISQQIVDGELSEKIIQSVSEAGNSRLSSFLKNPLLLTLYILTYKNSSEIPSKASVFYRRVIDSLFIEHDSKTKVGFQRERRSGISYDKFYDVMRKFSFVSFFDDQFAFEKLYASDLIQRIISKDTACQFKPEDLIEDLKLSFSFWIDDSGTISFAHKSLQEYFCALYIHDLDDGNKQKIYQKLLRKAGEVSDQFNILSILEEIDTCAYLQHYFIPVLADLKRLLDESNSVSEFISSIFPQIWMMPDKVMHVRFASGAFRFTQILDKKKGLFRELYAALREEGSKIDAAYTKPSGHKRSRRAYQIEFKSAPAEITSILNQNERLFEIRDSFISEVGQLMDEAYEEIRIQREIDEDIFSMI